MIKFPVYFKFMHSFYNGTIEALHNLYRNFGKVYSNEVDFFVNESKVN